MSRWGWPSADGKPSRTVEKMSESDELAVNCAREFAESEDMSIDICDVNGFVGKIKARMSGVRTTPTIIIGGSKVEGKLTRELENKLESILKKQTH